ncbi:MAG: LdpA C-terminal domain-containing domain [Leptolyngbya sp.]|nr:LdpA C-terminal domain-containing domain [Leptolyngbya sp.]
MSIVSETQPLPYRSLQTGQWVKLICGASYQDMPTIRRLAMIYALAGVDCVDVAADGAVVAAARQGLADAQVLAQRWARDGSAHQTPESGSRGIRHDLSQDLPWLMVSLNDSEDPHFRKAYFDPAQCPPECSRPCETLCPTQAIQFVAASPDHSASPDPSGVIPNLCYGCGRCIAVCPVQNIVAQAHRARPEDFPTEVLHQVDAVEIHTQAGRQPEFLALWQRLKPWRKHLKLVSISCPDDPQIEAYLWDLYEIMAPLEIPLIWQTDGRPMSGDLGKGTTHAAIRLAQKVIAANLPGYVQLAGGTNHYTVPKLKELGLVASHLPSKAEEAILPQRNAVTPGPQNQQRIAGIAYGSYARSLVMPLLDQLDPMLPLLLETGGAGMSEASLSTIDRTEDLEDLKVVLDQARQLVGALKSRGKVYASAEGRNP